VVNTSAESASDPHILRFGLFELDTEAQQLFKNGRVVRLQPKPFKLLCLFVGQAGKLVTRDDIQKALWTAETFVDFEQGVNFAVKQLRDALGEDSERPVYIQTVPRRGYRFVAPVERVALHPAAEDKVYRPETDGSLDKLLWMHIAELKITESRREQRRKALIKAATIGGAIIAVLALVAGIVFALR
jgi:DNA-binding winged helix-turn-helix (wHTH) protein